MTDRKPQRTVKKRKGGSATVRRSIRQGEPENRKRNGKQREIMYVTYFFTALFLVLSGYIMVYAATHEEELVNNSYNPRQQMLLTQNTRGTIYSADGEALAQTVTEENGESRREYPFANLFAHAVGYSSNGRMGVEAQMNYYLINSNVPFSQKAENETKGKKNPGDNVYTTLRVSLQKTASDALGVVYDGAIVAMNPKTGEIYAMVSKPDFDPNEIESIWNEVIEDKESSVLLNRVSQGLYPAGSTFKIVTALEYIREHPDSYQNYQYTCNGSITHGEDKISCYHGSVHGTVNLKKSFAKSCNTSFANIGLGLDRTQYAETLQKLYFNRELPVDFAYHKSSQVVENDTSDSDMMQNAIGQGKTQISPLHLAMITAAVANDGKMMKPYLVSEVRSADGTVVKQYNPSSAGQVMSGEEAAVLREYMEEVVESGTGTKLKGHAYTAAGKTGSAEYNTVKGESHAWFTGYAPAEDPEIVVTVIIEGAGSGGDYAVPIAKRVFDGYFQTGNE
ncbi:MAG: penicillin-binding protein 2 [Lachnospiraceae bacterium]|nr:penicillin-binding protein 2 [Lachnospiraceae bacterium]